LRGKYDIIIDCENGIPFFTPLYSGIPKILLLHHVHQDVFRKRFRFPIYNFAQILESKLAPLVYRNVKKVTVSESSRKEMIKIGLGMSYDIDVVHPGVGGEFFKTRQKTTYPSLLYLGRLMPWKSVDTAIMAMALVLAKFPKAVFTIAGFGEAREKLENLAGKLGIKESVKFLGYVSSEVKLQLLGESWVFVYPSTMEGWGISVVEAAASGTAVVASDVAGLRDSVRNPESGFLVPQGDVISFAEKINLIFSDRNLLQKLSDGGVRWAANFSWDKSAHDFAVIIMEELLRHNSLILNGLTVAKEDV